MNKILKWDPDNKTLSVFKDDSKAANDLRFVMNGDLLVCEGGSGMITRTNNPDPQKENLRAVYRVDLDGEIYQLLTEPEVHMSNGVVVSPDEQTLYLIEAHPAADHHRIIQAFDLGEDGSITYKRTLFDFYPGRSGDGMCIF